MSLHERISFVFSNYYPLLSLIFGSSDYFSPVRNLWINALLALIIVDSARS